MGARFLAPRLVDEMKVSDSMLREKWLEIDRLVSMSDGGDSRAQYTLAARLAQGYFVEKNEKGAMYWYAIAAAKGYTHAKFCLGTMLLDKKDVAGINRGLELVEQAARDGEPSALRFMAQVCFDGAYGQPRDAALGSYWQSRAASFENGDFTEFGSALELEDVLRDLARPDVVKIGPGKHSKKIS